MEHIRRSQWRSALENARDCFKAEAIRHRGLKSMLCVRVHPGHGKSARPRPGQDGVFQVQQATMTVMHPAGGFEHARLQFALIGEGLAPELRTVAADRYAETARQAFEGLLQSPDAVWSQLAPRMPACENLGIARLPWLHGHRHLVRRAIQKRIADEMGTDAAKEAGLEVPERDFYGVKYPCLTGGTKATLWTLALHNFGWRCSTAPEQPIEVKRCVYTSVMTWYFTDRDDPAEWSGRLLSDKSMFVKTPYDDSDEPAVPVPLRSFESWVTEDINLASVAMIDHLLSVADAETARCEPKWAEQMAGLPGRPSTTACALWIQAGRFSFIRDVESVRLDSVPIRVLSGESTKEQLQQALAIASWYLETLDIDTSAKEELKGDAGRGSDTWDARVNRLLRDLDATPRIERGMVAVMVLDTLLKEPNDNAVNQHDPVERKVPQWREPAFPTRAATLIEIAGWFKCRKAETVKLNANKGLIALKRTGERQWIASWDEVEMVNPDALPDCKP